jgi:hypothetical protein
MFRQASLILGAIVLIAAFNYRPPAGNAWDDVKTVPKKAPEKKGPEKFDKFDISEPEKYDNFDIGEPEPDPPAELDVDPTLEKPAPGGAAQKSGSGSRAALLAAGGGTKHTERAVVAALVWLANHQSADGSWSLHDYTKRCIDKTCTGQSDISSDAGATALGLLPFLAAGQTHKSKGPYQEHIVKAIDWLIRHQQKDGNLAKGSAQMMYGHGLATIALAEAYGLTADKQVGRAAQAAVNFILAAQNPKDGGWRYNPKDPGDTSVLGWQLTALKSAHMAGLDCGRDVFTNAGKYLDTVAIRGGTEYGYQPDVASSPTMTAVGLLGRQYLGAKRDNPMLTGGMTYLTSHSPDEGLPNVYYWYYGTQVMHNMSGYEWDAWNRKMRDILVRTQVRDLKMCANGSWDPAKDAWGRQGGRVMETSLSALTLEIYYRYLPIFKPEVMGSEEIDKGSKEKGADRPDADPFGSMRIGPSPKVAAGKETGGGPFGVRGSGNRQKMLTSGGGNEQSEQAVQAALVWLKNHQDRNGGWSLQNFTHQCKPDDRTCSGTGESPHDAAATAMGLLPFLAAGQTHKTKGPYTNTVYKGIEWLIKHQTADGCLAKGEAPMMYSHGMAATALCEAYGLTGDKQVGRAAQAAVNFILKAQNAADGGWRYNPGDPGDTSVTGWQFMALKSAHMAGLDVGKSVFPETSKWLDSVAVHDGTEYAYQPGGPPQNTMTSVGLLCRQYLGAKRDNPMLTGGAKYLLNNLPDKGLSNIYYWYYATQVMHNMGGTEWDAWNRKMRDLLVRTQVRDANSCANGSWAPADDLWGRRGGRVMTTSLSALTLEIYYRYQPLYQTEPKRGKEIGKGTSDREGGK